MVSTLRLAWQVATVTRIQNLTISRPCCRPEAPIHESVLHTAEVGTPQTPLEPIPTCPALGSLLESQT